MKKGTTPPASNIEKSKHVCAEKHKAAGVKEEDAILGYLRGTSKCTFFPVFLISRFIRSEIFQKWIFLRKKKRIPPPPLAIVYSIVTK
jgi:hypothetical protein